MPGVAAMLLERGQQAQIGPIALGDDGLDRGIDTPDGDRRDFARRQVGAVARAVPVVGEPERRRADFAASGQVAQHRHVAPGAVGADRFVDHDDRLAFVRLQSVQDGGDLLDHGERTVGPEHQRRVGGKECPQVGHGFAWILHRVQSSPHFSPGSRPASRPGARSVRSGPKSVAGTTVEARDAAGGRPGATRRAAQTMTLVRNAG